MPAAARLLRVATRRWRAVLVGLLLGLAGSLGFLALAAPTYTATTVVALRQPVTDPFSRPGAGADQAVNSEVETGLAAGTEVMAAVATALGQPVATVRDALVVEAPVSGQLQFRYAARHGGQAVQGADVAAGAYLRLRERAYSQQRTELVADYDAQLAELDDALMVAWQRLDDLPVSADSVGDPRVAGVLAELSGLYDERAGLREARSRLATVDTTAGWVTRPAVSVRSWPHDRPGAWVLAVAAAGGLLGMVAAFGAEATHRRVRSTTDAVESTGLPLLGVVRRRRPGVPAKVVEADTSYLALALANRLRGPAPPEQRLVLISPRQEPACATAAVRLVAGMAQELATAGRWVQVVGAPGQASELRVAVLGELRRHAPHLAGGADEAAGEWPVGLPVALADAPARAGWGGGAADGVVPETVLPPLAVVDGLPDWDEPAPDHGRLALLEAPLVLDQVLRTEPPPGADGTISVGTGRVSIGSDWLATDAEVVLVDAPAAEESAVGVLAARGALAAVVVACDQTRLAELRRLVDRLRGGGADPLGVIVTRC